MAARTGIMRRLYWDPAITAISAIGAGAEPDHGEIAAKYTSADYVASVSGLPDFGAPPAIIQSEPFGEDNSTPIASQATTPEGVIVLDFDEGLAKHKSLYELATAAALLVVIFTVTTPGTAAASGGTVKDPDATGVKGTFRVIEGTKSGRGLVPGGSVNEIERYQLGITKTTELTVFDS